MGGIVDVVENIVQLGLLSEEISEAVLKAEINKLMSSHEEEFEIMAQLQGFIDKISENQNSLQSQLSANVLFVRDSWNAIFDTLQDKSQFLASMITNFSSVKTSDINYTYQSGVSFGVSLLTSAYLAYSFIAGKAKTSITSDNTNFKQFVQTTSTVVRSSQPEIQGSTVDQNGLIQSKSFGTNAETLPAQFRLSKVKEIQDQEAGGEISSLAEKAVSLLSMASDVYSFISGVIDLVQLRQTFQANIKYFQSSGEFDNAEQGMLDLMKCTVIDIFNLVNSSRAAIFQCKNMLLVKSITTARYHESILALAKSLDLEKFCLTPQFFVESAKLNSQCNQVISSDETLKQKLEALKNYIKTFFDTFNPEQVFCNIASGLSKAVGEYSLISSDIDDDDNNVNLYLNKVSEIVRYTRDQDFNNKSPNQKKTIDQTILSSSIDKYNQIFDQSFTLATLDQETKDTILQTVLSFVDQFYCDDDSGRTFFGYDIEQTKSDVTYGQLLDSMELVKANVIPVRNVAGADEEKVIQQWVTIAEGLNQKDNYQYWGEGDKVDPVFRYIRLKAETGNSQNSPYKILSSFEGIRIGANGKIFDAERSVLHGTLTLNEVSS